MPRVNRQPTFLVCSYFSTYLRFRAGLKKQGLFDTDFLPFKSKLQPWSAWWAMLVCPITLLFR